MRKFLSLLVVLLTTVASAWADGSNLLSGKFSVSATKKVQFTKGNLYYSTTDNAYHLEPAQNATYGTGDGTYAATHVYHFFWVTPSEATTAATAPWAESFGTHTQTTSDKFFCGVDNPMSVDGTSGLYALTGGESGEWNYLINSRTNASSLYKYGVSVTTSAGTVANCLVIAPDDYDYTTNPLKASYTAEEWATAEAAGLVCLPAAGDRRGSYLDNGGDYGTYWSATLVDEYYVNYLDFDDSSVVPDYEDYRNNGYSVRLVKDAESTITEPEYVTIGGLRWATMNLGATTVAGSAETAYGDYYAWGEVDTYYSSINYSGTTPTITWKSSDKTYITGAKTGYDWSNYYGNSTAPSSEPWSPAPYDATSNLTSAYDVVNKTLGGTWRMPTSAEFKSLADACVETAGTYPISTTTTLPTSKGIYWYAGSGITDYGVSGMFFHDGTNYVFFPAAGYIYGTSLSDAGTCGSYWSSSLSDTSFAYGLGFSSDYFDPQGGDGYRCIGNTVRPVSPSTTAINNVNASTSSAQAQGKFIQNGKLVIVKAGKKYNAAGQMMK